MIARGPDGHYLFGMTPIYLGARPLVMIIGLLIFALAKTPDVKEIGRLGFFAGLFTLLMALPAR